MDAQTYPRSTYEIGLDAGYAARLAELHMRLYRRIHLLILAINFAASTAAFASLFNGDARLTAIAGMTIASLGFIDTVADFSGLVGRFSAQRARYLLFRAEVPHLELASAERELAKINADDPSEIESLRCIACNDNLMSAGRPDFMRPLTRWQRVVAALV